MNSEYPSDSISTVALLPWGDLFEDFFDTIGVSFDSFRDEHVGSYMFGYVNALKVVGVKTVIFFVSSRVTETRRFVHKPTETQVCILPASRIYRAYRALFNRARNAAGIHEDQKFSEVYDGHRPYSLVLLRLKDTIRSLGSYLSIPWKPLCQELRREGCTIILCQEYEHPRFDICVLIGKLLRLPVFATFQGGSPTQSLVEFPARNLALNNCDGLIIATRTEIERVLTSYKVSPKKIVRIFNPVDLSIWQLADRDAARKSLGISPVTQIVICHGRIEIERKGLDILLNAWKEVCNIRPKRKLLLLLIGTGSDANKLHKSIVDMELQDRILWIDNFISDRSHLKEFLAAADLYALPSRHEGFPVAPLEAMACGLPVVAADAPGIPDIFEHGRDSGGIIVPRGDATTLSESIGLLLDNAELRQQLGQLARQRVENSFSPEEVGKQLSEFLFL